MSINTQKEQDNIDNKNLELDVKFETIDNMYSGANSLIPQPEDQPKTPSSPGLDLKSLDVHEVQLLHSTNQVYIVDIRSIKEFEEKHIRHSIYGVMNPINVPQHMFGVWLNFFLKTDDPIIIVEKGYGVNENYAYQLLVNHVGFKNILGYIRGGIDAWINSGYLTSNIYSINYGVLNQVNFLYTDIDDFLPEQILIDARDTKGWKETGFKKGAKLVSFVKTNDMDLDPKAHYYVYSERGGRSLMVCSWMKLNGCDKVKNITIGIEGMLENGLVTETYVGGLQSRHIVSGRNSERDKKALNVGMCRNLWNCCFNR